VDAFSHTSLGKSAPMHVTCLILNKDTKLRVWCPMTFDHLTIL